MIDNIKKIYLPEDIIKITRVINDSFLTVANEFNYTKEKVPTFPAYITNDKIQQQIDKGLILFGYYFQNKITASIGYKESKSNNVYKIERLAVLPELRHKNIGKLLIEFIEQLIINNNGKIAEVEIVNNNMKLKKWYKNLGYNEIRIDEYEHLPFKVCVMDKILIK